MTHVNPCSCLPAGAPKIPGEQLLLNGFRKDRGNELPWDSWWMEDTQVARLQEAGQSSGTLVVLQLLGTSVGFFFSSS